MARCLLTEDCVNIGLLSLIEDNYNNSIFNFSLKFLKKHVSYPMSTLQRRRYRVTFSCTDVNICKT